MTESERNEEHTPHLLPLHLSEETNHIVGLKTLAKKTARRVKIINKQTIHLRGVKLMN